MYFVPKFPKKVQFLLNQPYKYIASLCKKTAIEEFVGGRPGYGKELLFVLLLIKKVTNWSYRDIADMGGVSHSTLVRANNFFLRKHIYEKYFAHLVLSAYKKGMIPAKYVALDSSYGVAACSCRTGPCHDISTSNPIWPTTNSRLRRDLQVSPMTRYHL